MSMYTCILSSFAISYSHNPFFAERERRISTVGFGGDGVLLFFFFGSRVGEVYVWFTARMIRPRLRIIIGVYLEGWPFLGLCMHAFTFYGMPKY